jgi:putative DNA primase/helicase
VTQTRQEMQRAAAAARHNQNGATAKNSARELDGDNPGQAWISELGPPAIFNAEGRPVKIYEPFWARLYAREQTALFEPNERRFYEYDSGTGIFAVVTEDAIRKKITERIEKASEEWSGFVGLRKFCSESSIRGVIAHLRGELEKAELFHSDKRIIHLANCVLQLGDDGLFTVEKFSPDFRSRNRSPINYEPNAVCPTFLERMLGHLEEDDRELLQKCAGQCLCGRNVTQSVLLLTGEGGASKSAMVSVLRGIVGAANAMELRTKHLEDRFEIGRMIGKTLLLGSDVRADFLSGAGAGRLKAIVGGDTLDAELKGSNKRISMAGSFNVIVTSNERLRVRLEGDRSAWERRLLIVQYDRPFSGKPIPNVDQVLLQQEGPGILNWCVEGVRKLFMDITKAGRISLSERQRERVHTLLSESDGLRIYLRENIVRTSNGANLTAAEIIEAYNTYCANCGWSPTPGNVAQRQLDDLMLELFSVAKVNNVPREGKAQRGFRNVRLRGTDELDPDTP